jgi:hypothetical protein
MAYLLIKKLAPSLECQLLVIAILKAFKDTKMMEAARNLVSLFFIFKNND